MAFGPTGYFSVLQEMAKFLVGPMEANGCRVSEKLMPDISQVKMPCKQLREEVGIDRSKLPNDAHAALARSRLACISARAALRTSSRLTASRSRRRAARSFIATTGRMVLALVGGDRQLVVQHLVAQGAGTSQPETGTLRGRVAAASPGCWPPLPR